MMPPETLRRIPLPVRLLLLVVVLAAVGLLVFRAVQSSAARDKGEIRASGIVEARTTEIASEVAGTVVERPIEKGQTVKAGDLVAVIASEVTAAQLQTAEAAVAAAREQLRKAEEGVKLQEGVSSGDLARSRAALGTATARYGDVRDGARPQEIEAAFAATRQAYAALEAAKAQLRQLERGLRPEEIRQAEAALEAATAEVRVAKASLADLEAGALAEEIRQAEAQVEKASAAVEKAHKDVVRARSLNAQGAMSDQQLDSAVTADDAAQAELKAARERLAQVKLGPRKDQVTAARAKLDKALASERGAREALTLARKGPRQEDIDRARAAVRQASATYDATTAQLRLVQAGSRRGAEKTARGQVDEARAALALAEANLRQVAVKKADADAAQKQVEQAQAGADAARASLDKYRVLARTPGVIDDTHVRVGEVVKQGSSLATLVDFTDTWISVYVPEPQLARVAVGQPVQVFIDGYPGQAFSGKVRRIAEQGEFTPKYVQTYEERARSVFRVEVAVDNARGIFKPGMPADAVIGAGAQGAGAVRP